LSGQINWFYVDPLQVNSNNMKKLLFILPATSILYFSCTKNISSRQSSPNDSLLTQTAAKDTLASGWTKTVVSDSSGLDDIFFINNTGFTAGEGPNIFKSIDGGDSWSPIPIPSTGSPYQVIVSVTMGAENNAVLVQPLNVLISTQDGSSFGYTTHNGTIISDAYFVDSTTAYASGTSIWKTTNGGNSWTQLYTFRTGAYLNDSTFYWSVLDFLNEQTGWVFGNFGLYKTTNGGVDWQLITTPFGLRQIGAIFFLNSDTGYVSNENSVEKTMDGGISWVKVYTGTSAYHDICFVSNETGYITDDTKIFKTVDGGNTWTREVALVSDRLVGLHFNDPNHGWACGANGVILKFSQ
jgi:photosystem II stability/assembly factor-like uncharacterized protein